MITITKKLISPDELKQRLTLSMQIKIAREKNIVEIKKILSGEDDRILLIVGPCSADSEEAFYKYLSLLKGLEKDVSNRIKILPRLYTAKPRSRGDNYKGIIYTKNPAENTIDLENGIITARRMFITAFSDFGFACADELLHTDTYDYFDDIATYAVIGTRNAENQQHRFLASGMDIPIAFKNPINGNLDSLTNAIYTAQRPNAFIYNGYQAVTDGNTFSHAILRGGVDRFGKHFSNYNIEELLRLKLCYDQSNIQNSAVIIDVNHSNSAKNYEKQGEILLSSYKQIKNAPILCGIFKGYMIESYIKDGSCRAGEKEFGKSFTDGCLGWEKTEELIRQFYSLI